MFKSNSEQFVTKLLVANAIRSPSFTARIAVGVGVGVGVGMPLIMVIIAVVIMMLYKSYHPTKYTPSSHYEESMQCPLAPKYVIIC